MITKEDLIADGWESKVLFPNTPQELTQWEKTINGFHYRLTDLKSTPFEGNLYEWECHIDNPDFETVASWEVDDLAAINIIKQIYKV